jgi:CheY-like chemotaxis protein
MEPLDFDRHDPRRRGTPSGRHHTPTGQVPHPGESSASVGLAGALDLERLDEQAGQVFHELGVSSEVGNQFFRHVPPRLTTIRLQLCTLARTPGASKRRACLAGLSMQCQWLAGYARMGGFHGLAQGAAALESLMKELYEAPDRLNESVIRTAAQATDLLNALASTAPARAGRAEGARVLVVDDNGRSRTNILAALETFAVAAVGVASADAALGLLTQNPVDVIIVQMDLNPHAASKLCQAIRRLQHHSKTPILVLSPEANWEGRAVLAMSGATEVAQGKLLRPELALKTLGHFFRARLSGQACQAHSLPAMAG